MLHTLLLIISIATGGGDSGTDAATARATEAAPTPALVAEDQTPTGRFLTATEIKPIMTATRANWIATRDFNGQDLVYVTHLWSWRCGLAQIEIAVNDAPLQVWPMPACHADEPAPNAVKPDDGLPYRAFPQGSVKAVHVRITYDDLTVDEARFDGKGMLQN